MTGVFASALSVAHKELRSSLRDRQTLLYMVVLPFALYPVLFWILLQGASFLRGSDQQRSVRVAVVSDARLPEPDLAERVAEALGQRPAGRSDLADGPVAVAVTLAGAPDAPAVADLLGPEATLDALLRLEPPPAAASLAFDSTRPSSSLARQRVAERLEALAATLRAEALAAAGASDAELAVLGVQVRDVSSFRDRGAYVFSLLLPMMFVFMGILGAFFPAVDVTAGEKERGTLETTLLLPVPRAGIHLGKILAVTAAATIAAGVNLLGMALAAEHLLAGLSTSDGAGFTIVIPWARLAALFPLGVLFLASTSALLVAAASFTETFKQGQSLLGSVQLLLLAPAFVGVLPGVELSAGLALVPVVQTVLAFRSILQEGQAVTPGLLGLVALSQLAYAALVTWFALWLQASERQLAPRRGGARRRGRRLFQRS